MTMQAALNEISVSNDGPVAIVTLNRPHKRNAISDGLVLAIEHAFLNLPKGTRAAVINGAGDHFCAGLDLSAKSMGEKRK